VRALEVDWTGLAAKSFKGATRYGHRKYQTHRYDDHGLREPILKGRVGGVVYGIVVATLAIYVSLPLAAIVGVLCARRLHLSQPEVVQPTAEVKRVAVAKALVAAPALQVEEDTEVLRATLSVVQNTEGWALQVIYMPSGEISMSQYKTKQSAVRRGTVMADELEEAGYKVKINA